MAQAAVSARVLSHLRSGEEGQARPQGLKAAMPKVVTFRRTPVFTNMRQKLVDEQFNVIHCKRCSAHVVITDADLATMPRRKTDGALVLDARKVVVRLNTSRRDGSQLIRRPNGAERQYVHDCGSCGQAVGYTSTPHEDDFQLFYIAEQAVDVPWHRVKTPWVCKVCGYVCKDQAHLESHRRQRQHFSEEAEKEAKEAETETKPIMVG
uniref:C2H2-type domain-containing protein n=1 Tax=Alexandrium andersonii TaxID=327968 RepID=A0A7S2CG10_9DINO